MHARTRSRTQTKHGHTCSVQVWRVTRWDRCKTATKTIREDDVTQSARNSCRVIQHGFDFKKIKNSSPVLAFVFPPWQNINADTNQFPGCLPNHSSNVSESFQPCNPGLAELQAENRSEPKGGRLSDKTAPECTRTVCDVARGGHVGWLCPCCQSQLVQCWRGLTAHLLSLSIVTLT